MTLSEINPVISRINNFSIFASVIILLLMFNYQDEIDKFFEVYQWRRNSPETFESEVPSYVSKYSVSTAVMIFTQNFCLFIVYVELSILSWNADVPMQLPMFLQMAVLFFYCSKHLQYHLQIMAMDRYSERNEQIKWTARFTFTIYFIAIIFVFLIRHMYFKPLLTFFLISSIWLPQILKNAYYG